MLFLLAAILFSTLILISFRLFPRFQVNIIQAITVNYIIAVATGLLISGNASPARFIHQPWLPNACLIGISFILVFFLFATSTQRAGVAITAVSSKMSVMIPVIIGFIAYSEPLNLLNIVGIVLTIASFFLIFHQKEKRNIHWKVIIFPILLFLGNGFNDSMMKFTERTHGTGQSLDFVTAIFSVSLLIGLSITSYRFISGKEHFCWKNLWAGIILGIFNLASTYFFFKALAHFNSAEFFPVFNASIVMTGALSGFFLFREKLSLVNWLGIVSSLLAIGLIAFS